MSGDSAFEDEIILSDEPVPPMRPGWYFCTETDCSSIGYAVPPDHICVPRPLTTTVKLGPVRRLNPSPGPLQYTVIDEAANVNWVELLGLLKRVESHFLAHTDTCPCSHCAHVRAFAVPVP